LKFVIGTSEQREMKNSLAKSQAKIKDLSHRRDDKKINNRALKINSFLISNETTMRNIFTQKRMIIIMGVPSVTLINKQL